MVSALTFRAFDFDGGETGRAKPAEFAWGEIVFGRGIVQWWNRWVFIRFPQTEKVSFFNIYSMIKFE